LLPWPPTMARADPSSSMAKSHNLTILLKIKKQNKTKP
jgi:hypothetical protein